MFEKIVPGTLIFSQAVDWGRQPGRVALSRDRLKPDARRQRLPAGIDWLFETSTQSVGTSRADPSA